ncbi:hypothetical protein EDEG_00711 [Edhazardia aedis USNM 41457]|uniref:Uncharacterized protein n=1 Tax=Edhazardia aedis (strain USNM 41457) TaxID=1003232 RepID=J9DBY9_EDHAE|nr:hypothetical protein EDEG_00711 [Edhazardia aedis USNM 41457]|eukprot:EJW05246.1 hypothetical protein EDEG_00711 [Edhazardia aedis USNM 41457]
MKALHGLFICTVFCNQTLYTISLDKSKSLTNQEHYLELKSNEKTYKFYKPDEKASPLKIQHHLSYMIQTIRAIKHPIFYKANLITYEVRPFDKIMMHVGNQCVLIGTYNDSFMKDNVFCQDFIYGDKCDITPKKRRKATLCFKPKIGDLKIESVLEPKTCEYQFMIAGESIVRNVNDIYLLKYTIKNNNEEDVFKRQNFGKLYNEEDHKEPEEVPGVIDDFASDE